MPDSLMIRCTRCGATNRVPVEKLEQGRQPVCGRCKAALPAADNKPVGVTDATFAAEKLSIHLCRSCWIYGRHGVAHAV